MYELCYLIVISKKNPCKYVVASKEVKHLEKQIYTSLLNSYMCIKSKTYSDLAYINDFINKENNSIKYGDKTRMIKHNSTITHKEKLNNKKTLLIYNKNDPNYKNTTSCTKFNNTKYAKYYFKKFKISNTLSLKLTSADSKINNFPNSSKNFNKKYKNSRNKKYEHVRKKNSLQSNKSKWEKNFEETASHSGKSKRTSNPNHTTETYDKSENSGMSQGRNNEELIVRSEHFLFDKGKVPKGVNISNDHCDDQRFYQKNNGDNEFSIAINGESTDEYVHTKRSSLESLSKHHSVINISDSQNGIRGEYLNGAEKKKKKENEERKKENKREKNSICATVSSRKGAYTSICKDKVKRGKQRNSSSAGEKNFSSECEPRGSSKRSESDNPSNSSRFELKKNSCDADTRGSNFKRCLEHECDAFPSDQNDGDDKMYPDSHSMHSLYSKRWIKRKSYLYKLDRNEDPPTKDNSKTYNASNNSCTVHKKGRDKNKAHRMREEEDYTHSLENNACSNFKNVFSVLFRKDEMKDNTIKEMHTSEVQVNQVYTHDVYNCSIFPCNYNLIKNICNVNIKQEEKKCDAISQHKAEKGRGVTERKQESELKKGKMEKRHRNQNSADQDGGPCARGDANGYGDTDGSGNDYNDDYYVCDNDDRDYTHEYQSEGQFTHRNYAGDYADCESYGSDDNPGWTTNEDVVKKPRVTNPLKSKSMQEKTFLSEGSKIYEISNEAMERSEKEQTVNKNVLFCKSKSSLCISKNNDNTPCNYPLRGHNSNKFITFTNNFFHKNSNNVLKNVSNSNSNYKINRINMIKHHEILDKIVELDITSQTKKKNKNDKNEMSTLKKKNYFTSKKGKKYTSFFLENTKIKFLFMCIPKFFENFFDMSKRIFFDLKKKKILMQNATWKSKIFIPERDPLGLFKNTSLEKWYISWMDEFNKNIISKTCYIHIYLIIYIILLDFLTAYKLYSTKILYSPIRHGSYLNYFFGKSLINIFLYIFYFLLTFKIKKYNYYDIRKYYVWTLLLCIAKLIISSLDIYVAITSLDYFSCPYFTVLATDGEFPDEALFPLSQTHVWGECTYTTHFRIFYTSAFRPLVHLHLTPPSLHLSLAHDLIKTSSTYDS
ncbi:hypothetical protein, conserved [Plasmodium ovale wallikeri]|uniref:Uncharacterized protein n=1 Tax=Plasmodium ovale wallikeri TaxID=864142 RepID=A0A1A8YQG0_PLAOA|nr:hypothetical protein, conserved [Plasmodium ovale wallikeri]